MAKGRKHSKSQTHSSYQNSQLTEHFSIKEFGITISIIALIIIILILGWLLWKCKTELSTANLTKSN